LTSSSFGDIVITRMNTKWIFIDGVSKLEYFSFPYAYRSMYNAIRKGTEGGGRKFEEMIRGMKIIGPTGREYSYEKATQLAEEQGLITPTGEINSREFKRSR